MLNKFKYAVRTVRSRGFSQLKSEVKIKISQKLAGNKLSNLFNKMGQIKLSDGNLTTLYAGYRDYIQPYHFISHADENATNRYFSENIEDWITASISGSKTFFSQVIKDNSIDIKNKKILEIGSSDTSLSYMLALKGAVEIHATDIDYDFKNKYAHHLCKIKERLFSEFNLDEKSISEIEKKVNVYYLDIQNANINDKFDIIISKTVLEHIVDLKSGIESMSNLLKPGGIMLHQFNPFYSETGGHEYCILDFPWGHVRQTEDEFEKYLEIYRSWEKDKAMNFYKNCFNHPKMSLEEIDKSFESNGLKILEAFEKRRYKWKTDEPASVILNQARKVYKNVTLRDLYSDYVLRIIKK